MKPAFQFDFSARPITYTRPRQHTMLHECRACPEAEKSKTNTSLGIPHTFSFPLLPTHECRAVNLHMMTLKILFHMDVKWGTRRSAGHGPETGFEEIGALTTVIASSFLEADLSGPK